MPLADAVSSAIGRARMAVGRLVYERRFGLDTGGFSHLPEHTGENNAYSGASWRLLPNWLPREALTPDAVLIDVGCGKGRVVFSAARLYPFKRVIGTDLAAELVDVARSNIERNRRHLKVDDIELLAVDAATWPIPDDVTIVVLVNPFGGSVFDRFMDQLTASLERRPRRLFVLYAYAHEHERLVRDGGFKLLRAEREPIHTRLYEFDNR